MHRRQSPLPRQWLIVDRPADPVLLDMLRRLPRGTGVVILQREERHRLHRAAWALGLIVAEESSGGAARVHTIRELRAALLRRTPVILLSPIFATRSHPDWAPIQRMRAAALARLGGRRLIALGGMNSRRFARIAPLGFAGWAGISAWHAR